jgi:lipopolysaccharide transport system ATP-binding protein
MSRPVIVVEGISKSYRLGAKGKTRPTLREALVSAARSPFRRESARSRDARETFWALKDVSFEVQPGEMVGLIGRNGAGKSTLLKILSRITEPTEGLVRLRGRIASLLEVGTGFHPELTGRENVYLNGSILGMKRAEIDRKFDEIVAFAEVERFLDTQVKYYSSGMYVRLAFAVAAHLEPEILVIDEVLAVGDANYQKKCIDRMADLRGSGKTILLVSHNMDLIPRLCSRAVLLTSGRVAQVGPAAEVTRAYLASQSVDSAAVELTDKARAGTGQARFTKLQLVNTAGEPIDFHASGDDLIFEFEIEADHTIADVALAVTLSTIQGLKVVSSWTKEVGFPVELRKGKQSFRCGFSQLWLRPSHQVSVSLWMADADVIDNVEGATVIDVIDSRQSQQISNRSDQSLIVCPYVYSRVEERDSVLS